MQFCEYIALIKIKGNQYMNQKALQILEYHKIIEKLTDKASSAPGKELCRNLLPETDMEAITTNHAGCGLGSG